MFLKRKFKSLIIWTLMNIKPINRIFSDETYLKMIYRLYFNQKLDLNNPKRFTEKIQWLKLYNKSQLCTTLADKYAVKKYISDLLGERYVIPLIGVYDRFDDIDFEKLPQQFVLKTTHDSGGPIICKNKTKFDIQPARKKLSSRLKTNYYYKGREHPYKNIPPRIIAEEYMEDEYGELRDYKFFCFNGVVKLFKIDSGRYTHHQANYYNTQKEYLPFGESHFLFAPPQSGEQIFPDNFDEMIQMAETIAAKFPFVRVDFYNVKGKIYFGEVTFHPAGGLDKFVPDEWDFHLGDMLVLPNQ